MPDPFNPRFSNKAYLATGAGLVGGAIYSGYRGTPVVRPSAFIAMNVGLVGAGCFAIEHMLGLAMDSVVSDQTLANPYKNLWSHGVAGFIGGGLVGLFVNRRPFPGAMLITPVMLLIGYGENEFRMMRRERQERWLEEYRANN